MPPLAEVFLLAVASALWPALVAVVVVALRTPRPGPILACFLAGAMLTTVSVGLAVVFSLRNSDIVQGPHPPVDPAVDLTVGLLALLGSYVVSRRPRRHDRPTPRPRDRPAWSERMIARGAGLAFPVGIALNLFPGLFPFVALKDIAELDYSTGATVLLVIGFYVVMLTIVEVPLVALLVAPERTARAVEGFNSWLGRNGRRLIAVSLAVIGVYLIVRGVVAAAR
jgi:Sap, sulfolipid-1-addressing protein